MPGVQREIERECVPFWRYFRDPEKQREYVKYRRDSHHHASPFSVFLAIATLGSVFILMRDFTCPDKHLLQPNEALCRFRILSALLLRNPVVWSLVLCSLFGFDFDAIYSKILQKLGLKKLVGYTFYADVVIVVTSLTISMIVFALSASGACPARAPGFKLQNTYCNPGASLGFLPPGHMLVLAVGLNFFHVSLKGSSWFVILFAFLIEMVSVLSSMYLIKGTLIDSTILFPLLWKVFHAIIYTINPITNSDY